MKKSAPPAPETLFDWHPAGGGEIVSEKEEIEQSGGALLGARHTSKSG